MSYYVSNVKPFQGVRIYAFGRFRGEKVRDFQIVGFCKFRNSPAADAPAALLLICRNRVLYRNSLRSYAANQYMERDKMRIAVCDDNMVMLDYLARQISECFTLYAIEHDVSKFLRGTDFVEHHEQKPFDIVFLDIKMPDMDGFEVAKRIRAMSENTYIVFVTTEDSLVYDSFDFRPFNFISKISNEMLKIKLDNVIRKLVEHMRENYPICLSLPFNEKKYVHPDDIIYILSKSNYLDVSCRKETVHIRGKIDSMLGLLSPKFFMRIHNRCIVNLNHLCSIDSTHSKALLDNGAELDISRSYKAALAERYNMFLRDFT